MGITLQSSDGSLVVTLHAEQFDVCHNANVGAAGIGHFVEERTFDRENVHTLDDDDADHTCSMKQLQRFVSVDDSH